MKLKEVYLQELKEADESNVDNASATLKKIISLRQDIRHCEKALDACIQYRYNILYPRIQWWDKELMIVVKQNGGK